MRAIHPANHFVSCNASCIVDERAGRLADYQLTVEIASGELAGLTEVGAP